VTAVPERSCQEERARSRGGPGALCLPGGRRNPREGNPLYDNPNGAKPSPDVETLDPFLARRPAPLGFSSAPVVSKHQVSDI